MATPLIPVKIFALATGSKAATPATVDLLVAPGVNALSVDPATGKLVAAVGADTPFYLVGGTTNAGGNKTTGIYRTGLIRSSSSAADTANAITLDGTNPLGPVLQAGTNASPAQYFSFGSYSNQNNFDTKTRNFQIFSTVAPNAYSFRASDGWQGINLAPADIRSMFDINGSVGFAIVVTGATSYTQRPIDFGVVMTTSGAIFAMASTVLRRMFYVKNGSTGNITAAGHIDNVINTTVTIPSGQSRWFHGDGTTNWLV